MSPIPPPPTAWTARCAIVICSGVLLEAYSWVLGRVCGDSRGLGACPHHPIRDCLATGLHLAALGNLQHAGRYEGAPPTNWLWLMQAACMPPQSQLLCRRKKWSPWSSGEWQEAAAGARQSCTMHQGKGCSAEGRIGPLRNPVNDRQ